MTASTGSWSGAEPISLSYQWQRCDSAGEGCEDIVEATSSSYTAGRADVASTLRVIVTATNADGATLASSAHSSAVAGVAPSSTSLPQISGVVQDTDTLSASAGEWTGTTPMAYTYQWERCDGQAGNCTRIEGATHRSYTLTEGDVGSTLIVEVSAESSLGATTAVSAPTAEIGVDALTRYSPPTISGVVELGGELEADPGIWSATGAVTDEYQWERCDAAGEECAPIAGATALTDTPTSADNGYTLRVKATATSPLGSESAVSAPTGAGSDEEATVEEAKQSAQQIDPAIFARSSSVNIEEQSVAPALADENEELVAHATLASSTVSKETPGEFAVNGPPGELSLTPVEPLPSASKLPTIVNGVAALFANTWPSTDTIVRPGPLGETTFLDIRSAQAPRSFSWKMHLGPEQELQQLPNGSVAIDQVEEAAPEPGEAQEASQIPPVHTSETSATESPEEREEREHAEAEAPGENEELPLEPLAAAPTATTTEGETPSGQPRPQETQASYESAKAAMSYAETQKGPRALLAIAQPTVTGSKAETIPASLSVNGETVTLTVDPGSGAAYPLLAQISVAAPTNKVSAERDPVVWGISDPLPQEGGHIDQHFTENGAVANGFDPQLSDGPEHTTRHIRTARIIVAWNAFTGTDHKAKEERSILEAFLNKDAIDKAAHQELEPYITIGKNFEKEPCGDDGQSACPEPTTTEYHAAVRTMMTVVLEGHTTKHWPLVKWWGAWNEPDIHDNPLHNDEVRAAQFWEEARATLAEVRQHHPCAHCSIVAGEFSQWNSKYVDCYRNMIVENRCKPHESYPYRRFWAGKPAYWGFHDYADVVHRNTSTLEHFTALIKSRLGKAKLLMSEAGVERETGDINTTIMWEPEHPVREILERYLSMQANAAHQFLALPTKAIELPPSKRAPILRMYYYQYTSPSVTQQIIDHTFDSALFEEEHGERRVRPAYCVLAFASGMCPPTPVTESVKTEPRGSCPAFKDATLKGTVNPNGGQTTYYFEYGPTTAYGHSTTHHSTGGWVSVPITLELPVLLTQGEHNECLPPMHYRVVARNAAGVRYGSDETAEYHLVTGS